MLIITLADKNLLQKVKENFDGYWIYWCYNSIVSLKITLEINKLKQK